MVSWPIEQLYEAHTVLAGTSISSGIDVCWPWPSQTVGLLQSPLTSITGVPSGAGGRVHAPPTHLAARLQASASPGQDVPSAFGEYVHLPVTHTGDS